MKKEKKKKEDKIPLSRYLRFNFEDKTNIGNKQYLENICMLNIRVSKKKNTLYEMSPIFGKKIWAGPPG